jgi:RNA polymerase sigma-70 factor (ECF subfamily)
VDDATERMQMREPQQLASRPARAQSPAWMGSGVDMLAGTQGISARDATRFREAVLEHSPGLLRFLRGMGLPPHRADDVAQTAFLVALQRLPQIVEGSERAFVYATAVRTVHGIRRRTQREVLGDLELDRCSSPSPSPEDFADQKRARELLDELLESIDGEPRAVFVRFEVDGFTIPEIATALAITRKTAICRLRRARRQFRALLRHLHPASL